MAGLFKTIGSALNTVTTAVVAIDTVVSNTAVLLDKGFIGINIPLDNMLADLNCDNIIDDAKRRQRMHTANAEADAIIKAITPTVRKPRAKPKPTVKKP